MDYLRELARMLCESPTISTIEFRLGFGWLTIRMTKLPVSTNERQQDQRLSEEPTTTLPVATLERRVSVISETVGYFRRKDKHGKEYVTVGTRVTPETTLAVVDTMGLEVRINPKIHGIVLECSVADGHPVEYGQQLFVLATIDTPNPPHPG